MKRTDRMVGIEGTAHGRGPRAATASSIQPPALPGGWVTLQAQLPTTTNSQRDLDADHQEDSAYSPPRARRSDRCTARHSSTDAAPATARNTPDRQRNATNTRKQGASSTMPQTCGVVQARRQRRTRYRLIGARSVIAISLLLKRDAGHRRAVVTCESRDPYAAAEVFRSRSRSPAVRRHDVMVMGPALAGTKEVRAAAADIVSVTPRPA